MPPGKRNSSRAVFTSHERDMARSAWSATSARLTRDSFLPFGSCILCMEQARDPVCCTEGDLMCRECALLNVLGQKKEIKRTEKERERAAKGLEKERKQKEEKDKEDEVRRWERVQQGLENAKPSVVDVADDIPQASKTSQLLLEASKASTSLLLEDGSSSSNKRKAPSSLPSAAPAAKQIRKDEPKGKSETSFWTPSLTPFTNPLVALAAAPEKAHPICPGPGSSNSQHIITTKHLLTLRFSGPNSVLWDGDAESDAQRTSGKPRWFCPSCVKPLTNATGGVVTKCGHICCRGCAEMMAEEEVPACFVCSEEAEGKGKKRPKGWVELRSEGTGFTARGGNKVEKLITAFNA